MLREIEVAAARVSDMVVSPGLVVLDLPLHKTATGGERTLTRRSLRCACGAATHPLCPVHAAMRHLVRLGAAGLLSSAGPLFPGRGGGTRSKEDSVSLLRRALAAASLVTTYQDAGRPPAEQPWGCPWPPRQAWPPNTCRSIPLGPSNGTLSRLRWRWPRRRLHTP